MNNLMGSVSENTNESEEDSSLTKRRKLEIEKLEEEISKLKRETKPNCAKMILPLITALVAVAGFIGGIWQFNEGQKQSAEKIISAENIAADKIRASETQARKDLLASKEQEYLQKFWQERLKLYEELTRAAGQIASSDTLDDAKTSIGVFWKLYWGPLSILEDRVVLSATVDYGEKLKKMEAKAKTEEVMLKDLQSEAYNLARACRKSLEKTWNPLDLDDIDDFSLNPFRASKN